MCDREDGFTLIELMIVVMFIGILIVIAFPYFLGARDRSNDAAAKQAVTQALESGECCSPTMPPTRARRPPRSIRSSRA